MPVNDTATEPVRVAIDNKKLRVLLETGAICAADLHCLDCASKHCVWKLCLEACARRLGTPPGKKSG